MPRTPRSRAPPQKIPPLTNIAVAWRRDFFAKNYGKIKQANATLPILLRESSGVAAKVTATYGALRSAQHLDPTSFPGGPSQDSHPGSHLSPAAAEFGVEKEAALEGLSTEQIGSAVETLMKGS